MAEQAVRDRDLVGLKQNKLPPNLVGLEVKLSEKGTNFRGLIGWILGVVVVVGCCRRVWWRSGSSATLGIVFGSVDQ